jgi:hypothetical protein
LAVSDFFFILHFWHMVSLCSLGWPWNCIPSAPAYQVLRCKCLPPNHANSTLLSFSSSAGDCTRLWAC